MIVIKTTKYCVKIATDENKVRRAMERLYTDIRKEGYDSDFTDMNFISGISIYTNGIGVEKELQFKEILETFYKYVKEEGGR